MGKLFLIIMFVVSQAVAIYRLTQHDEGRACFCSIQGCIFLLCLVILGQRNKQ